jgi:hypothetical protein
MDAWRAGSNSPDPVDALQPMVAPRGDLVVSYHHNRNFIAGIDG